VTNRRGGVSYFSFVLPGSECACSRRRGHHRTKGLRNERAAAEARLRRTTIKRIMNHLGLAATRLSLACLLAGGAFAVSVQSGTVSALTVPASALPSGCALAPPPATSPAPIVRGGVTVIPVTARSQFPANPWSGTDRKTVAAVHRAIDAAPGKPLPDVPPTPPGTAAAFDQKWADNILEAYHAAYTAVDGYAVEVFAVTFSDVKLTTAPASLSAMLNPPRGVTARLVRGATVVRVSAPTSTDCFGAVRAYIESSKI
jgi:hypothetical protein